MSRVPSNQVAPTALTSPRWATDMVFTSQINNDLGPLLFEGASEALGARQIILAQHSLTETVTVDWVILLARTSREGIRLHAIFRTSLQPTHWYYLEPDAKWTNMPPYWQLVRDALIHAALRPEVQPAAF